MEGRDLTSGGSSFFFFLTLHVKRKKKKTWKWSCWIITAVCVYSHFSPSFFFFIFFSWRLLFVPFFLETVTVSRHQMTEEKSWAYNTKGDDLSCSRELSWSGREIKQTFGRKRKREKKWLSYSRLKTIDILSRPLYIRNWSIAERIKVRGDDLRAAYKRLGCEV